MPASNSNYDEECHWPQADLESIQMFLEMVGHQPNHQCYIWKWWRDAHLHPSSCICSIHVFIVCCKNCSPFVATVASVNHTNSILELNINHMPMPLLLKPNMRSHTSFSISYLFILFILSGSMAFSFPRWCLWGWERWFLWEGKADRLEVYLSLDMGRSHH